MLKNTNQLNFDHNSAGKQYSDTIVVTGGEPLMWNMGPLTQGLQNEKLATHIETSGAYPLSGHWDWICLSPKKRMLPLDSIYKVANELRLSYITKRFCFCRRTSSKYSPIVAFLQPEWSKREQVIPDIVDYVLKNPKWKASLQTHKYMNIIELKVLIHSHLESIFFNEFKPKNSAIDGSSIILKIFLPLTEVSYLSVG